MSRYDLIVIGGGPAGMMAAGQAAQAGADTFVRGRICRSDTGCCVLLEDGVYVRADVPDPGCAYFRVDCRCRN